MAEIYDRISSYVLMLFTGASVLLGSGRAAATMRLLNWVITRFSDLTSRNPISAKSPIFSAVRFMRGWLRRKFAELPPRASGPVRSIPLYHRLWAALYISIIVTLYCKYRFWLESPIELKITESKLKISSFYLVLNIIIQLS